LADAGESVNTGLDYWTTGLLDYWTDNNCKYKWDVHGVGTGPMTFTLYIIGDQQLKQMQSGCIWVWPYETSARQRCYHTRAVGASE